jgi:hypothetical protein
MKKTTTRAISIRAAFRLFSLWAEFDLQKMIGQQFVRGNISQEITIHLPCSTVGVEITPALENTIILFRFVF